MAKSGLGDGRARGTGGRMREEALAQRQELDRQKRLLCEQNDVRLIEWPYSLEPTDRNIREILQKDEEDGKKRRMEK